MVHVKYLEQCLAHNMPSITVNCCYYDCSSWTLGIEVICYGSRLFLICEKSEVEKRSEEAVEAGAKFPVKHAELLSEWTPTQNW